MKETTPKKARLSVDLDPDTLRTLKVKLLNRNPPLSIKEWVHGQVDAFLAIKPSTKKP